MSTITATPDHPAGQLHPAVSRQGRVYRSRSRPRPPHAATTLANGPSFPKFHAALRERPPVVTAALDHVPLEAQMLPLEMPPASWRRRAACLLLAASVVGVVILAWSDLWPVSGASEHPTFQGAVELEHPSVVAPEARLDLPFAAQARMPKARLHQPSDGRHELQNAPARHQQ